MAKSAPFDFELTKSKLAKLFAQTSQPKVEVTDLQLEQLTTVVEMLNTWNAALNLTAIKDVNEMLVLHIMDSAQIAPIVAMVNQSREQVSIADVGTGPGFPGMVLAILHPEWNFTLIDSVGKKLSFVRQVVAKLKLKNVELINKRCEEISHEPFDCIVSRAFAPLDRMVNWCLPLLADHGHFVAMKANLEDSEKNAVPHSVEIKEMVDIKVPNLDAKRIAVILSKI